MINNHTAKSEKASRKLKFSYCPQCGYKGMYHVRHRYYRCRYCGLYRISLPGQDF
jgi:anaerobic ribonucleoside-triphosphate reductase